MTIQAIPTRWAGCYFRSRLEARWAVFFDAAGIKWQYEPEGYELSDGTRYLPDFLLPECGTWVEVKGSDQQLDHSLIHQAVKDLPRIDHPGERGPKLMILGPIPEPISQGDWGWVGGSDTEWCEVTGLDPWDGRYGFGMFYKNRRPWWLDNAAGGKPWTIATLDEYETGIPSAYAAARSARFEHGQSG